MMAKVYKFLPSSDKSEQEPHAMSQQQWRVYLLY